MVNIQSVAAEIRRGKKKKIEGKKLHGKNIMAPLLHRAAIISRLFFIAEGVEEMMQDRCINVSKGHSLAAT